MAADEQQVNGDGTVAVTDQQAKDKEKASEVLKQMRKKLLPGLKYSLLLMLIVHLAMLVIGCLNVHNCPADENIPFFLIVAGGVGLFVKFLTYVQDKISKHIQLKYILSSLYTIETVNFFIGTYWVYRAYKPDFVNEVDQTSYCNKTAYLFAFIYITVHYAIILGAIAFLCCFAICFCTLAGAILANCCAMDCGDDDEEKPESQVPYIDQTSETAVDDVEQGRK